MLFTSDNNSYSENCILRGRHCKVAVGCWFTTKGRALPKLIKYEDERGGIRTLEHIQVLKSDRKYYAGTLSRRYECKVEMDQKEIFFSLLYHPDDNTWDMVILE